MLAAMDLAELLVAYRADEPWARRQFGLELHRLIVPIFRGRFDEATVEDLTQETIIVVLRELHRFEDRGPGSFRAWVRRIGHYRKLSFVRRRKGFEELDEHTQASTDPSTTERLHWRERVTVMLEVFGAVDPVFASALEFLVQGGHPAELAEELALKPQTIRTRASRALAALRRLLDERWETSATFFTPPP